MDKKRDSAVDEKKIDRRLRIDRLNLGLDNAHALN